MLRSWWLQKTQEFRPRHAFNEGTLRVCVCVCVFVCIYIYMCGWFLAYEHNARFVAHLGYLTL